MRILKRLGLAAGTFILVFACFQLFVRPWMLSWGATAEEQDRMLPGDDIVPYASTQNTRAITIRANVDRVWPWLAQIGQDRAGFYSYERLEDLVGAEMPHSDTLYSDLQQWRLGNKLWMYPPDKAGGIGFATLRVHEPGRVLGFGTRMTGTTLAERENGSWTFVLEPIDESTTRLLIRGRGTDERTLLGTLFDRTVFEPAHFAMERRMMVGLAGAVEGNPPSQVADDVQLALWVLAFALVGIANGLVVFSDRWERPLAGLVSGLVVFQVLTLGQPHVLVGVGLVAGVAAVIWWPWRARTARERYADAVAAADQAAHAPA